MKQMDEPDFSFYFVLFVYFVVHSIFTVTHC
jgi:hypothetical protein